MNTRLLVRLPVVLISLLLVGGYVYVRAGGSLPWQAGAIPKERPARLESEPLAGPSAASPVVVETLPGSKSMLVFEPSDGALPVVTKVETAATPPGPAQPGQAVMGGTKSAAVFAPSDAKTVTTILADSAPLEPRADEAAKKEAASKTLIYGSKSAPVFLPSDGPPLQPEQPAQKQQQPAAQQAVAPPPKSDLVLPGSKSDRIFTPSDIPTTNQASGQR